MNVSRREFLKAGAGVAAGWWAGGCAGLATRTGDNRRQARNVARVVMDESSTVGRAGYFRVGRSRTGRWWLVTPAGEPFLYRGVCALWMPDNGQGADAVRFRRHWERANGKDTEAFAAHYVREYFRVTAEAIRAHDPNHLLLGPRFGGTPGNEVLRAIDRRHTDVLSWNYYNPGFHGRCAEMHAATGLPQLNGGG
jgi:hypothetical protein